MGTCSRGSRLPSASSLSAVLQVCSRCAQRPFVRAVLLIVLRVQIACKIFELIGRFCSLRPATLGMTTCSSASTLPAELQVPLNCPDIHVGGLRLGLNFIMLAQPSNL